MVQPIGYIKLHRELVTKPIWLNSTPEQKTILVTLLTMANFKPKQWEWQGRKFNVKPGQFITSAKSICDCCGLGISRQNVRSSLARFEKLGFLTMESTKTGILVTIVNWELYQSDDVDPTNDPTNAQPRPNQRPTTREERKKEKNDKNVFKTYSGNTELNASLISFVEFRKSIKRPMTDRAVELLIGKLNKLSSDESIQIQILEQSILNGWIGVFELKSNQQQSKNDIKNQKTYKHDENYTEEELENKLRKKGSLK